MNITLSTLTGTTVEDVRSILVRGFMGVSTDTANCLIRASSVYSICSGVILAIDRSFKTDDWCVTVEVDSQRWIRYCGLSSTGVLVGQQLVKGTLVGYGNKGTMQLEYCTSNKSLFPVRLLGRQLYKHDPTPIIFTKQDISEVL